MSRGPAGRIQRKNLALTYPMTDGNKEDLLQFLCTKLAAFTVKYGIVCKELHANGEPHFHAYMMLEMKMRLTDMSALDWDGHHPHIEEVKCPREWINYVKKGNDWVECGVNPVREKRMERRERLQFFVNHSLRECIECGEFSIFELTRRQVLLQQLQASEPQWPVYQKRLVYWLYGPTNSGKTRYATDLMEANMPGNWTICGGDMKQFLNYSGQSGVIFDDFRAGCIRFERLLQLTDGYRAFVNVKGGYCEWLADTIVFTAPVKPEEMFVNRETNELWDHLDQLLRRIDVLLEFPREDATEFFYQAPPPPGPHDVPWLSDETPIAPEELETMQSFIPRTQTNQGLN